MAFAREAMRIYHQQKIAEQDERNAEVPAELKPPAEEDIQAANEQDPAAGLMGEDKKLMEKAIKQAEKAAEAAEKQQAKAADGPTENKSAKSGK